MRLFARLLLALLAFTASVPTCAMAPAAIPAMAMAPAPAPATGTGTDHAIGMHHRTQENGRHHDCAGATCIGCAIELPRGIAPAPQFAWAALPAFGPVARQRDGRGPAAATPPPRNLG